MTLTSKQEKYIEILRKTFNIHDAYGRVFPYDPLPYQEQYHADCMLCTDDLKHRIWSKSRGIGATLCTMIDALMVAHTFDGVTIPVSSKSSETAGTPIDWACWLADNTQIPGFFDRDTRMTQVCRLGNGSEIIAIPGGNPNVLRSIRAVFIVHDEFAFHEYPKEVYVAGDGCLSEGGQTSVLSTWNGKQNEYARIWDNAEELGYRRYEVKAFPDSFDITKSIEENMRTGIVPVSPWFDLKKMEMSRKYDPSAFLQEYMCSPSDQDIAFLDWELITSHCRVGLEQSKRESINPYFFGLDFATDTDYSVFTVFELTPEWGAVMRYLKRFRKMDSVPQLEHLELLERDFGFSKIGIDSTGPGKGIYDFARKKFGHKVIGLNFASKVRPVGQTGEKMDALQKRQEQYKLARVPIKRALANALRMALIDDRCWLISEMWLRQDLNSVPYDSLDAPKSKNGHGDAFWSCAITLYLAAMPVGADPVIFESIMSKGLEISVEQEDDELHLKYAQRQMDEMNAI